MLIRNQFLSKRQQHQMKETKKHDKPKVTTRTSYQPKIVAAKIPGSLDDISYPNPDPSAPTVSILQPRMPEPSAPPTLQVLDER